MQQQQGGSGGQGVPSGPAGLDHISRSSGGPISTIADSNRPLNATAAVPLESVTNSNNGKMLPLDVLCKNCRKEANFMCSACKSVHYCSIDCQVCNWYFKIIESF